MSDNSVKTAVSAKTLWVQAMRSGDFEQCTGRRKNVLGQFCAIGLLSHIVTDDRRVSTPICVLSDITGMPGYLLSHVVSMNDTGASFEEIADTVERHPHV
jgi:hypothetical protein